MVTPSASPAAPRLSAVAPTRGPAGPARRSLARRANPARGRLARVVAAPRASSSRDAPRGVEAISSSSSGSSSGSGSLDASSPSPSFPPHPALARRLASASAAFAASVTLALAPPSALAGVDPRALESGKCLLSRCQLELAQCVADEKCAESLVCLNTCFGKPDEADCQIRCGDLYADKAVQTFNTCAITTNDCVKQKPDTGEYPAPPLDAMAPGFDAKIFGDKSRWYIVAGLNKDFDVFDCQEHFFDAPDADHMAVKINWRINRPNGQFYERSDVQTFYADERSKSILHNNGNEYLHYQDDWYVPGFKEGEYVFVYYRGSNDAWDGYGGAVVYSTSPELNPEWVPELTAIASKVGVKFSDMIVTDNSCKPEPELRITRPADLDTLGDDFIAVEREVGKDFRLGAGFLGKEARLGAREVGRDARLIEREVEKDLEAIEREVEKDIKYEAKVLKDDLVKIEEKLVSFGPRFTFLETPEMRNMAKNEDFDARAQKKAEKKLDKVEKAVRAADAKAAKEKEAQ